MSDINALKRERRAKTIDQLVADATTKKYCTDGLCWRPIYDFGHAPMTTNLQQLNEIGIVPVSLENLTAQETIEALQLIIRGLAKLGVFWLHTNHLADAEFYECLMSKIMVQPVRDLSFDAGVREFIDLTGWQSEVPVVDVCERDERLPKPIAPSGSSVNATIGGC